MLTRKMLDQFMQELLHVLNAELCAQTPCDPPPWEANLVQVGFTDDSLAVASYVLAAFADECTGDSLLNWGNEACKSWSILLFRESCAGLHYFEKMDASVNDAELLSLWWLGLRAGLQGRFLGDPEALDAWLAERSLNQLPKGFPTVIVEVRNDFPSRNVLPWWICFVLWFIALVVYQVLVISAEAHV